MKVSSTYTLIFNKCFIQALVTQNFIFTKQRKWCRRVSDLCATNLKLVLHLLWLPNGSNIAPKTYPLANKPYFPTKVCLFKLKNTHLWNDLELILHFAFKKNVTLKIKKNMILLSWIGSFPRKKLHFFLLVLQKKLVRVHP